MARAEQRPEGKLFETDFLLGVCDGHRMGGLRFKAQPEGPFLDDSHKFAAPPWISLRQLESISMRLEEEDAHSGRGPRSVVLGRRRVWSMKTGNCGLPNFRALVMGMKQRRQGSREVLANRRPAHFARSGFQSWGLKQRVRR